MQNVTIKKTKKHLIIKIPIDSVEEGRAELSPKAQKTIDKALDDGLADLETGRTFGPFETVEEFKKAVAKLPQK